MKAVWNGTSIWGGIVIGKLWIYDKKRKAVKRTQIVDIQREIERYEQAKAKALKQLHELYEKAVREVGEANAQIFEGHAMMLEDAEYQTSVTEQIKTQRVNAEYAVETVGNHLSAMFAKMDDDYLKERAIDVKDISTRMIAILSEDSNETELTEPVIVVAEELTPSETVQMNKENVLGFVTRWGTEHSHVAILAQTMNIPAISEVEFSEEMHGKIAILDAFEGKIIVEPKEEELEYYKRCIQEEDEKKQRLIQYKGRETINKYGKKIALCANIGEVSDLAAVYENDAEGIGLLRSEFLYMKEDGYPSEELLFRNYRQIVQAMEGRKVIIRTMDIGADKQVDYFQLEKEENPAMGYRAIRICLTKEEIFRTQLRAILRAGVYGKVSVMYPMITSVWEIRKIKEIVTELKKELDAENIRYGEVEQGIMIETPAAAMISDWLAKEVDFFSIGTNDLSQYTLAIDRQNPKLERFYDAHHEAILRLIRMTVENGHKEGIWVGICGELAGDMELTDLFMEMGVDELSVAPTRVLALRKKILEG